MSQHKKDYEKAARDQLAQWVYDYVYGPVWKGMILARAEGDDQYGIVAIDQPEQDDAGE